MSVKLGDKAKDTISGFEGIVTATSEYLNGCARVLIESMGLQESGVPMEAQWFDDVQVEVIKSGAFTKGKKKVGGPARSDPRRSDPV